MTCCICNDVIAPYKLNSSNRIQFCSICAYTSSLQKFILTIEEKKQIGYQIFSTILPFLPYDIIKKITKF